MALLSGEVETLSASGALSLINRFRMALLSGEVETLTVCDCPLRYELFRMALLSGEVETGSPGVADQSALSRSGWLCYPGKLKPESSPGDPACHCRVPDGFAIRGS